MPLPAGARPGTLPDGSLVWLDAQGNPINPDGTPLTGSGQATPVAPTPATRPVGSTLPPLPVGSLGGPTPQPAVASTTPAVGGTDAVQIPQATNIDPTAGTAPAQPAPANTAGAAGATGSGGANPQAVSLPAGTSPVAEQMLRDTNAQVDAANVDIAKQGANIRDLQARLSKAQDPANPDPTTAAQLTTQIDAAYNAFSASETKLASASKNQADAANQVLQNVSLTPQQADYYTAQAASANANATKATADTKVLLDGADTQKAYVAAQAEASSASAAANRAAAQATTDKTPAEIDQLHQQAAALKAQADTANALLPGLQAKQAADTSVSTTQAGLNDANSDLARANAAKATADKNLVDVQTSTAQASLTAGQPQATVAATTAQANANNAQATAALEGIKQKQQGPLYGLQDQINAIHTIAGQVFGPGGTGDPSHADDLLKQYVTATIGGTTPYAASVAATTAQQNQFGTQAAMQNQQVQAAASRANQYAGLAGTTLGTLEQMNQYAPKGSTAMAGAFRGVMDEMAQRLQAPQFQAPQQPQAPDLPTFLQGFTAGHRAATATAATAVQATTGAGAAGAAGAAPGGAGGGTPINININGQPAGGAPAGGAPPAAPQQTPQQAFSQGLASNAPQLPNYLGSLANPMSMLTSAQNLGNYNQGPGNGTPQAGSLMY